MHSGSFETVQLHPQYVQYLAQKVWIFTEREVDDQTFAKSLEELLKDTGIAFSTRCGTTHINPS